MLTSCACVECSTKVRSRLEVLIKALNDLNTLEITSPQKLDLIFVISNEINSENNLVIQLQRNQDVLQTKIKEVEDGLPLPGTKNCIENSLKALKESSPAEYDKLKEFVDKYWAGKYQLEESK